MKYRPDVKKAIDAYALSVKPVLCGAPEPEIDWEESETREEKAANNLADTLQFVDFHRGQL